MPPAAGGGKERPRRDHLGFLRGAGVRRAVRDAHRPGASAVPGGGRGARAPPSVRGAEPRRARGPPGAVPRGAGRLHRRVLPGHDGHGADAEGRGLGGDRRSDPAGGARADRDRRVFGRRSSAGGCEGGDSGRQTGRGARGPAGGGGGVHGAAAAEGPARRRSSLPGPARAEGAAHRGGDGGRGAGVADPVVRAVSGAVAVGAGARNRPQRGGRAGAPEVDQLRAHFLRGCGGRRRAGASAPRAVLLGGQPAAGQGAAGSHRHREDPRPRLQDAPSRQHAAGGTRDGPGALRGRVGPARRAPASAAHRGPAPGRRRLQLGPSTPVGGSGGALRGRVGGGVG